MFRVLPTLPSQALDWTGPAPVVERVQYPTRSGPVDADLYRPATGGPFPGAVVCLGVVPFGVEHPQVQRLGMAFAGAGVAALIHWSPAMRDFRLQPEDSADIAMAYEWLIDQRYVDPARSGLVGTCVGGSFALMAAANARVRDRIAFVAAFAPYASLWTFGRDISSRSRVVNEGREPWSVDPLTRKVYVRSLTAILEPDEGAWLHEAVFDDSSERGDHILSETGRAVQTLLTTMDVTAAEAALDRLPPALRERLDALSPMRYLPDVRAPLIVLAHDQDDPVIPLSETRGLKAALADNPGLHYTEFTMFKHMDPTRVSLPLFSLARELGKFYLFLYPIFRQMTALDERPIEDACRSHVAEP